MGISPFSQQAAKLLSQNYSIIPIKPKDKMPGQFIRTVNGMAWVGLRYWNKFAETLPSKKDISDWESWPEAGIGVCLGKVSGIVAIDYDNHPEIWQAVERILPESPVKKKGAKGYTAFYRYSGETNDKWVTEAGNTVIDLLSTGRQTVVPPSIHPSGASYAYLTETELGDISAKDLPKLPPLEEIDAALEPFYVTSSRVQTSKRPESSWDNGVVDKDDLIAALSHISPDVDNDTWVKIGMGIKSTFGDKGLTLWDRWSSHGKKYKEKEPAMRWRSFTRDGVTAKYIFRLATDAGYKRKLDLAKANTIEDIDLLPSWPEDDSDITPKKIHTAKPQDIILEKTASKPQTAKKATVTSIKTKMQLDIDDVAKALGKLPLDCQPIHFLREVDPVLKMIANSNGEMDVFVLSQIKQSWKFLKSKDISVLSNKIKEYRKKFTGETEENNNSDNDDNSSSDKPKPAPRRSYYARFAEFFGTPTPRRDIFSNELCYWDEKEQKWLPGKNLLREIRSSILTYQEKNKDLKYYKGDVEDHFYAWCQEHKPRLCVDIPKWDKQPRIEPLARRLKLQPLFSEVYGLTIDHVVELVKDWHARMWLRYANPLDIDAQNRVLVLSGGQGMGKDFWVLENVGALGQFALPMEIQQYNPRDTKMQLHQGLVLIISEFDRTAALHSSQLKDIITTPSTFVRAAYERCATPRTSRCSFIASCNKGISDILNDYTGNRRYIPIPLSDIDKSTRFTQEDKLQILAEGRILARNRTFASQETESLLATYLHSQTPASPEEIVLEMWDQLATEFVEQKIKENSLDVDKSMRSYYEECQEARASKFAPPGDFSGFLPNSLSGEIFEVISRRTRYVDRRIRRILRSRSPMGEHGESARIYINSQQVRGFFYGDGNSEIQSKLEDEIPF